MDVQEGRDRRQHPRAIVSCPVIIMSTRGLMSGETRDVSYGGAFIRCREPLKPKEVLEVSISVSLLCPRVQVTAEVMWSNFSASDDQLRPRGMGVRFTNIAGTDQEMISALVEDNLQKEKPDRPERSSTV